jgi:hypothetical protein
MMSGNAGIDQYFAVLVAADLGVRFNIHVEHLLPFDLPLGVVLLRFVECDGARRLVAAAPRRQKDDRRQQVETPERPDQFWRRNVRGTLIHGNQYSRRDAKRASD